MEGRNKELENEVLAQRKAVEAAVAEARTLAGEGRRKDQDVSSEPALGGGGGGVLLGGVAAFLGREGGVAGVRKGCGRGGFVEARGISGVAERRAAWRTALPPRPLGLYSAPRETNQARQQAS